MPRIPESAVTVGQPAISGQPIRDVQTVTRAVEGLGRAAIEFQERRQAAQRRVDFVEFSTAYSNSVAGLQFEIDRDPEIRRVEDAEFAFDDGIQKIGADLFPQIQDDAVRLGVEQEAVGVAGRTRIAVKQTAFGKQKAHALVVATQSDEQLARDYVLTDIDDDEARAENFRQQEIRTRAQAPMIDELVAETRITAYRTGAERARVRNLIDLGQYNLARDLLADQTQLQNLDENQRIDLRHILTTAESQRATRDASRQNEIGEETAKAAYFQIEEAKEGRAPVYTLDDLRGDKHNLSFQDLRTISVAMDKQGAVTVNDEDEHARLHELITAGDPNTRDEIHKARRAGSLTKETFDELLDEDRTVNVTGEFGAPYRDSRASLKRGLGPIETETGFLRAQAEQRANRAVDDLRRFVQTKPDATSIEIYKERDRLMASFAPISQEETAFILGAPYSFATKADIDSEQIKAAKIRLSDDFAAGIVDVRRMRDETDNIRSWEGWLSRNEARRAKRTTQND